MKRTILTLTMVVASSVCTQSFGFDLLDRMLGMKGCGSSTSCCEAPSCDDNCCEPACGAETSCCESLCSEPACGAETICCEPAGCEPACGCETSFCEAPSCDTQCCEPKEKLCTGLLSKLFGKKGSSSCCEAPSCCEPACGCETASCEPTCCEAPSCDTGCCSSKKSGGLLSKLFGNLSCGKKSDCCDMGCDSVCNSGCGCGAPYAAPVAAPIYQDSTPEFESAPMPPAPIVDPSASITRNRRVIQASASYAR